ncbi:MAG: hypothetical protein ACK515_24350 [bacterium]|nr:hypothetical protein [Betaproteobacteria bacterium]
MKHAHIHPTAAPSRERARVAQALGVVALSAGLLGAHPAAAAQGHGGQTAQGGARDSGSSRHLQLRADPPPPPAAAQPFGYPGVPAGGTRRAIIVNPQQPLPGSQPGQVQPVQPVQPAAQLSRDADPREVSNRSLRADVPPPAPPVGYPPANAGRVIIIAPAPTQSFAGSGTSLPER